MVTVAKSGWPVMGQTHVNSGVSHRTSYRRPGCGFGTATRSREGTEGIGRDGPQGPAALLLGAEHPVDLGAAHGAGPLGGAAAVGHLNLFALEVALLAALHAVTVELSHVVSSLGTVLKKKSSLVDLEA